MKGRNSIKSIEMAMLTFYAQTGIGMLVLPAAMAKEVGHDGWITVLIAGIFFAILGCFIIFLLRRYSNRNIYEISQLIFGKMIGTGFNVLLVLYLFIVCIGGVSLFSSYVRITILHDTPSWILSPFITMPSIYLVWQGLKAMGRFLYVSILSYAVLIVFLILLLKDVRISFLLPIGESGINQILTGTQSALFAFIGLELIIFFYPYITDQHKALKWHIIAIISSTIFYVLFVAVVTGIFGENLLSIMAIPYYNLSRVYNAPILERVDLYLIAIWIVPMACSLRSFIFACFDGLLKVFKVKRTRISYTIFFLLILIVGGFPKDTSQVNAIAKIIATIGGYVLIFLVMCLFLSFVRKKGVKVQ